MKFWSVIVLIFFLNFSALPSIAAFFDWDLHGTTTVLNEEEPHSNSSTIVYEKTIPKIMDVYDFLKFSESAFDGPSFLLKDDDFHMAPLLTIFSPPPEI